MKLSELLKKLFGARRHEARAGGENRVGLSGDGVESTSGKVEPFDDEGESFDAEEDVDPFDPFPDAVTLEITDVFDLHSIPPREVRAVVEEYLREARREGFRVVRIIHGKGVGVQREIVRSVLARTPFVERYADAPADAGGWGATVAFLSPPERP
jgi:dsDNA-specific endonuclease/ATPase MutS2